VCFACRVARGLAARGGAWRRAEGDKERRGLRQRVQCGEEGPAARGHIAEGLVGSERGRLAHAHHVLDTG
jgi:hypothetical protein